LTKFNQKTVCLSNFPDKKTNKAGGIAFGMDEKLELVTRTASYLISEDKFYANGCTVDSEYLKVVKRVQEFDPEFILKLAWYSRDVFNLRSAPLYLLAQHSVSNLPINGSRGYIGKCIKRADEITELLSLSMNLRLKDPKFAEKRQSLFIKGGVKDTFNKFNKYQLAKYNRDGNVTLKDAIRLTHPKPYNDESQKLYADILNDSLESPNTWEVHISKNGSTKENWEQIIPQMNFMAILRNLRNFLDKDVDLSYVIYLLTNPESVKRSKQLPFRFMSAYEAIQSAGFRSNEPKVKSLMTALETAIDLSVENIPKVDGRTLILIDVSGSMHQNISGKSKVKAIDTALIMGAIASKVCEDSDIKLFADSFENVRFSKNTSILERVNKMKTVSCGGSTNLHVALFDILKNRTKYDRIILLSDMQCYGYYNVANLFLQYKKNVSNAFIYSIDLTGYGTAQIPKDVSKVCTLAGWSEKIFDFMYLFEIGRETIVKTIERDYSLS